jgi:hypothetical protein
MPENAGGNSNYIKYLSNPKGFTMKKWFYDLLGLEYAGHDAIIERVATSLTTQQDLEDFGKLIGQVYEKGYRKAIDDYKKEAERVGLKVSVVAPPPTS